MEVLTTFDADRLRRARAADEYVWVDLVAPSPAELAAVGRELALHPLAIEDTQDFGQRPKLDSYDDTILIVFYGAQDSGPVEVHLHIAHKLLLTVRQQPFAPVDALRSQPADPTRPEGRIVYRVLDALTDSLAPVIERYEEAIDRLEAQVLTRPQRQQLQAVYTLKRATSDLQRRVVAQRDQFPDVTERLMGRPEVPEGARAYLDDVGDHLAQAAGDLARQTSDLSALTDLYFSANADRVGVVSERLTVVATILLPMTVVTGFFGQNFGWLVDHIDSLWTFLVFGVGGLVVPTLVAVAILFARRRASDL